MPPPARNVTYTEPSGPTAMSGLVAWWRSLSGRPARQLVLAALIALVLAGDVGQTALWVSQANANGLEYGSRACPA